jgi:hypothetical protein
MVVRPTEHRMPDERALLQDLGEIRRRASFKAMIARNKLPPRPVARPLPRKMRAAGKTVHQPR